MLLLLTLGCQSGSIRLGPADTGGIAVLPPSDTAEVEHIGGSIDTSDTSDTSTEPPDYTDGDADLLYDPAVLPTFSLDIPDASRRALDNDPGTYQPATFHYGDVALEVGVHLKGSASLRTLSQKASFRIKFDEIVPDQRFYGLRRLTLDNSVQDASLLVERLSYAFYRAAGAVAPRCNSAMVYVNGEYMGLYANIETIDDQFLQARFDPAPGNLYDISDYFVDVVPGDADLYDRETNQDDPDRSDIANLITAANGPAATFATDVSTMLDLDEVLAVGAAQAVAADWDGYFGAKNNYKLQHELASDRFQLLPYGTDQDFLYVDYALDGSQSNRDNGWLFVQCKADPACLARYATAVGAAADTFASLDMPGLLDTFWAQIQDAAYADPRKETSNDAMDDQRQLVRAFLVARPAKVRAALAAGLAPR